MKNNKGISLVETMVGMTIVMVSLGALMTLYVQALGIQSIIRDRYIATFLAVEGIEMMKNEFDNEMVGASCNGLCDNTSLNNSNLPSFASSNSPQTFFNGRFSRMHSATITDFDGDPSNGNDGILVTSEIIWTTHGGLSQHIKLAERIYRVNFHQSL